MKTNRQFNNQQRPGNGKTHDGAAILIIVCLVAMAALMLSQLLNL